MLSKNSAMASTTHSLSSRPVKMTINSELLRNIDTICSTTVHIAVKNSAHNAAVRKSFKNI